MRLRVASVADYAFSILPSTKMVTALFQYHGFDYEPVVDMLWFGWPSKLQGFIRLVRGLDASYTHIMFIDARDVVPLAGPDAVMERYLEFGHPWVYAAEPFIWSQGSFAPGDYPTPADATYRYLNAGACIGEVEHIRSWFGRWPEPVDLPRGDQDWLAARYIESYPDAIELDIGCELFQCMCGSEVGDEPFVTLSPGKAYNRITDTYPLMVHANGGSDITDEHFRTLWGHYFD